MGSTHLMRSYIVALGWSKGDTIPGGSVLVALNINAHIANYSGRGWMPHVRGAPAPRAPPVPTLV